MRHIFRSIRTKITILMILIVLLLITISTYLNIRLSEINTEQLQKKRGLLIAAELDTGIRRPENLLDKKNLMGKIEVAIQATRSAQEISLFLWDGKELKPYLSNLNGNIECDPETLTAYRMGEVQSSLKSMGGTRHWTISSPLHINNKTVGAIQIKISLKEADILIRNLAEQGLMIAAGSVFMITLALGFFLQRTVNRPLIELVRAMRRVEGGNLTIELGHKTNDEFDILTDNFNQMLRRIEAASRENRELLDRINRFNEELKVQIHAATKELAEKNDALVRLNALLFDMQRKLSHSEKLAAIGQLAATVAHQVGTPLHSISGHIQLAMQSEDLDTGIRHRLEIVESQVNRVVGIIQDILNFTRKVEVRHEPLDMNQLLLDIIEVVSPGLSMKEIHIEYDLGSNLPMISADREEIEEIFLNLINNALDAMGQRGVLRVRTFLTELNGKKAVGAEIEDNGCGIPAENIDKIFQPFFSTKGESRGTGLGLAIVEQIVKNYGGIIQVESQEGKGAMFRLLFPIQQKG